VHFCLWHQTPDFLIRGFWVQFCLWHQTPNFLIWRLLGAILPVASNTRFPHPGLLGAILPLASNTQFPHLEAFGCNFACGIKHSISSSFLRACCHMAPNLQVTGLGGGRLRAFLTSGHELAHSGGFSGHELAHSWESWHS